MITQPYIIHALSPLHAGTGQGVGFIDLPIARERTTEHPLIPGSSLKGVLRDAARGREGVNVDEIFGSAEGSASTVRVSDARVLAFPVKSDCGTFAWVTSAYVLLRFARDSGVEAGFVASHVPQLATGMAVCAHENAVVEAGKVTLDGVSYDCHAVDDRHEVDEGSRTVMRALANAAFSGDDPTTGRWRALFAERLVIVSDDVFTGLTQTATDVRAHIRIDDKTGTAAKGTLRYVETLPPETLLAGIVQVAAVRPGQQPSAALELLHQIASAPLQVGGDATTGAGRVRLVLSGGAE